ncbi:NAD(P)/FAD-dependent oxidoreductase [bacterium]|nr:MAG: NAD(P)/FAD-dependent oxidoreductase [bacterium]
MQRRKHLIIGTGAGGLSALKQIRKLGSEDAVKLVTMEGYLPYSPMSLPYLISGRRKESEIYTADENFFDRMDATLIRGKQAIRIDPPENRVIFDDKSSETYDTLLIATGSDPFLQPVLLEADIPGFHVMDDYFYLKEKIKNMGKVIILGAGFVGTELAVSLAEKGHDVTIVAPRERILRLYFDPQLDDLIIDLFAEHGIRVERNWGEVNRVHKVNGSFELDFHNNKKGKADMVIAATGVTPRTSLIEGSGIRVNRGIVVDRNMKSNIPNIFAAGDVAEAPHLLTGENGLSLIWPSAVEQGKVAGSNMAGEERQYEGWLSMNIFNFLGHVAQSIGEAAALKEDETLIDKDADARSFKKLIIRKGKLVGAQFFNVEVDGGAIRYLIKRGVNVGPHKELLLDRPKEAGLWLMNKSEGEDAGSLE